MARMDFDKPDFKHLLFDAIFNSEIMSNIIPLYKGYVKSVGLNGNEGVLEFGSGTGGASRHLAKLLFMGNGRLTCVDTSEALTKIARKRLRKYANVEFKTGDIRNLDVEDLSYDAVFVHFVLHDVEEGSRQDVVSALSKKLKAGGKLFVREPTKESHGISADEIRALMASASLTERTFRVSKSVFFGPIYVGVFVKSST